MHVAGLLTGTRVALLGFFLVKAFGHFGSGGALGFADPDAGVAFGYAMNHLVPRWRSARNRALVDATFAALAARG